MVHQVQHHLAPSGTRMFSSTVLPNSYLHHHITISCRGRLCRLPTHHNTSTCLTALLRSCRSLCTVTCHPAAENGRAFCTHAGALPSSHAAASAADFCRSGRATCSPSAGLPASLSRPAHVPAYSSLCRTRGRPAQAAAGVFVSCVAVGCWAVLAMCYRDAGERTTQVSQPLLIMRAGFSQAAPG
jgi:hypothetical protein